MRLQEEIEQRRQWALAHGFTERNALNYAQCDPDEEEDWMEWYEARQRSGQKAAELVIRNIKASMGL